MAEVIGVCGAGTMGAGIAELAARAGARVVIYDPVADVPDVTRNLADLQRCDLVIEAAPEALELKRELFAAVEDVVAEDCVLATNTSSLPVTEIAAGARRPERIVGMHFFNPPTRMRLVEVVAGARSSPEALRVAREAGEAMGRHVIDATDGPGFLVNRCNRPFGLEAARIVEEGLATPEQVDRIMRMACGFRMGPFELMDLVGLDVTFAVQRSFFEQSFGEPRWRPSQAVGRLVAAGRLGRKSGEGWYAHPHDRALPEPPEPGAGDGLVVIAGDSALAGELADAALDAGWDVASPDEAAGEVPALIVDCGATDEDPPLQGGPQILLCDVAPLSGLDAGGTSAGFFALPPFAESRLVELTRQPTTSPAAAAAAQRFFGSLGRLVEWVGDAPGLVSGRIVCQLVNEACFALGAGVGSAVDIDAGMVLGLNHPRGPLEWADLAGPAEILAVVGGLHHEYAEERYRPAPVLHRAVRAELPLHGRNV